MYALAGGAQRVVSVDSSPSALAGLQENLELNFSRPPHAAAAADCFEFLKESTESFDIAVVDPPAFAKSRSALQPALRAYREINALTLKRLNLGGQLMAYSCSQIVSSEQLREVLLAAAEKTAVRLEFIKELTQAPCHRIISAFPEGRYLKGFLCRVERA